MKHLCQFGQRTLKLHCKEEATVFRVRRFMIQVAPIETVALCWMHDNASTRLGWEEISYEDFVILDVLDS